MATTMGRIILPVLHAVLLRFEMKHFFQFVANSKLTYSRRFIINLKHLHNQF